MAKGFASDKHALGECQRCGVKMLLKFMLNDGYYPNLIVCPSCWEPRHPQESLPNVEDPVSLYRPAPLNLPTPTAMVLSAAINVGQAVLTWTNPDAPATLIKSFEIWRSMNVLPTDVSFLESFTRIGTTTVQRAYDTTITNNPFTFTDNTTDFSVNFYHYYIVAIPVQGPSERSNIAPLATPPAAVVLSAVYNPTIVRIELSWTASSSDSNSIGSYRVERSVDGGAWTTLATVSNVTLTYNDSAIDRNLHTYNYRVFAIDAISLVSAASNTQFFAKLIQPGQFVIDKLVTSRDPSIQWLYPVPAAGADLDIKANGASTVNYSTLPILPIYPKPASGKYYWEMKCTGVGTRFNSGFDQCYGFTTDAQGLQPNTDLNTTHGVNNVAYLDGYEGGTSSAIIANGATQATQPAGAVVVNTIVHCAVDFALNKFWVGENGVWFGAGTQNPATGQGGFWPSDETSVSLPGSTPRRHYGPWFTMTSGQPGAEESEFRFSQSKWTLTPPAGFGPWLPYGPFVTPDTTPAFIDIAGSLVIKQFVPGLAWASNNVNAPRQLRSQVQRGGAASGKRYFEVTYMGDGATSGLSTQAFQSGIVRTIDSGTVDINTAGIGQDGFGGVRSHGSTLAPYGATQYMNTVDARATSAMQGGDTMMVAVDFAAEKIYLGMNGVWYAGQDPTNPANGATLPNLGQTNWVAAGGGNAGPPKYLMNTGAIPFFHTMPAGYKAWDQE